MFSRSLYVLLFILVSLQQRAEAADEATLQRLAAMYGVDSPNKSAVAVLRTEGLGGLASLKQKKEAAKEQERDEQRKQEVRRQLDLIRHQEEEKQAQESERAKQRLDEAVRLEQAKLNTQTTKLELEKAAVIRTFEELLKQERDASQKRQFDLDQMKLEFERKEKEARESQAALKERETKLEALLRSAGSLSNGDGTQQIEELQRALDAERAKRVKESDAELRKKLEEAEQRNIELEAELSAVKTGQAYVITRDAMFVRYDEPYIHTDHLRLPDSKFDIEVVTQGLLGEINNLATFVDQLERNLKEKKEPNVKGIFLSMAKTFVENLKSAAASGDFAQLPTLIEKIKERGGMGLKHLLASPEFQTIEDKASWLVTNLVGLENTMQHKAYYKRQLEVTTLIQPYCERCYEFYSDYFDRIIPKICILIAPTSTDPGGIQASKRETIIKLLTCAIPALKLELPQSFKPYGTVESYIQMIAHQSAKLQDYTEFKDALAEYDSMLKQLPIEHIRLVDDLLTYQFFQMRYKAALKDLEGANPKSIHDISVRNVIAEMLGKDVLKYGEVQVLQFSRSVSDAVKIYMSKKSVNPEELLIEPKIKQILVSYSLLHKAAIKMKEGNPKLHKYHQ